MPGRSLRSALFWAILGAVLLCIGASVVLGIGLTRSAVSKSVRRDLGRQADIAATRLEVIGLGGSVPPPQGFDPDHDGRPGGPPDGRDGGRDGPMPRILTYAAATGLLGSDAVKKLQAGGGVNGTLSEHGRTELYAARPLASRVLLLSRPDIGTSDYSRYLAALLIAAGLGVVLAAITAALLARRLAAPLTRLAAAARQLASGSDPEPLPVERTAELAAVSTAFNDMAAQLGVAREAERAVLLSVSHELRTPLTAIRGYAEGIEDGTVEPVGAAGVVGREAERLERLVNDLLALARLEQGVLGVRAETLDLRDAATQTEARLAPLARERGVSLEVAAPEPSLVVGDPDRVVQVLSNLVQNAVRVTPEGGSVTIAVRGPEAVVADTGPGIPAEDLPHAFERFHLHRRSGLGSPDGSGLGLAIVQQLTEAMGGTVGVESRPGEGARFTVRLRPAEAAEPPAAAADPAAPVPAADAARPA
jgi:signal transduction histidine kinase